MVDVVSVRRALVFVAALAALGPAGLPQNALASTYSISGTVINDDTGNPQSGVVVGTCGPPGCAGSPGTSDGSGNYTITGLPASGNWNVLTNVNSTGSFPGCTGLAKAHRYGVSTQSGNATGVTLHVTGHIGEITGTVYAPNGSPMANVGLVVDNSQTGGYGYGVATSDGSGHYSVPCLASGNTTAGSGAYFITAFPPSGSGVSQQQDSGISVGSSGATGHDIHLGSGNGSIYGTVTCNGASCNAAVGVLVFCENCSSSANVTTANNGTYSAAVQGGYVYDVHVFAPTPSYDNQIVYAVSVGVASSAQVNVNLPLSGPGTSGRITGSVTDPGGAGIAGCLINAFGTNGFTEGTVTTDANGSYDTGYVLSPGSYIVFIDCPNQSEVRANGGNSVAMSAGSTAVVSYSTGTEPTRPYTGGSDAIGLGAPTSNAYFAEGFTGINGSLSFHEYITIQNPTGSAETVDIDYLIAGGGVITKVYTLPASSRTTVIVNKDVGAFQQVSAHVRCDSSSPGCLFVAERPMYFYFPGIGDGGDDVMGAAQLGMTFYFAEGYTGPGFHEFLTLMDPNGTDANVNVAYFFNGGGQATVSHTIPHQSRLTVDVNQDSGCSCEVSMQVSGQNGVSFLAERPMYFDLNGLTGGDVAVGTSSPQMHLNLAEGFVSPSFNEFLTFLNPSSQAAAVTISYLTQTVGVVTARITVGAHSRFTETVNNDLPPFTPTGVHIDSTQPIVVERPMYFNFGGRTGGHVAMAVPDSSLGTTFDFAEGFVSSTFDEYYTILDNTATAAAITITFYLASGPPVQVQTTVAAFGRQTVHVNDYLSAFTANSAQVTSTNAVPVLVERPMYFAY